MPFGLQPTHLVILLVTCLMCVTPILIVGGVVYIIVSRSGKNQEQLNTPSLDILKMRYAKGEITEDQFNKMKNDLS
ncbi:MAG: SHOCT domain-containing protein [Chloroflexota bacterium]|nr:SHOCT domain-containing protein [Chloroflexota bacterium]